MSITSNNSKGKEEESEDPEVPLGPDCSCEDSELPEDNHNTDDNSSFPHTAVVGNRANGDIITILLSCINFDLNCPGSTCLPTFECSQLGITQTRKKCLSIIVFPVVSTVAGIVSVMLWRKCNKKKNNKPDFFRDKKIFEERKISDEGKGLHTGIIYALETLADGRLLSGSSDRTIKIWDKNREGNYESQETLTACFSVHALAELSNNSFISSVDDQNFYLWALQKDTCSINFSNAGNFSAQTTANVYSIAAFPNGNFVSGSKRGEVGIWSPHISPLGNRTYVLNQSFTGHENKEILGLTILSQTRFASSGSDGKIYLWFPERGLYKPKEVGIHGNRTSALITLPDNQTLISGADDGTLKLWVPNSKNSNFYTLKQTFNENNPKAESIDQIVVIGCDSLVIATERGNLALCEVKSGIEKDYWCSNYQSAYMKETITALTALANKQWIATGSESGKLNIWAVDFANNTTPIFNEVDRAIGIDDYHHGTIYALATLSDGDLITGSNDGSIKVWHEVSPGIYKSQQTLSLLDKGDTTGVTAIHTFSNNHFISGSSISNQSSNTDQTEFELWQPKIDECERSYSLRNIFKGDDAYRNIYALATLEDGRFVSGNQAGVIRIWNPVKAINCSENCIPKEISSHTGKVNKIVLLSHNRFASSGNDGIRYLWLPKGSTYERKYIGSHYKTGNDYKSVTIAALSDNSTIVSGGSDGTLKIWAPNEEDANSYSCTQTFNKRNSDNSNESINRIVAVAGDQLVAATDRGKLAFCKNIGTRSLKNYNCSSYFEAHTNDTITALTTFNNKQWIATGTARSDMKIWSINPSLTHQEDNPQSQESGNQASLRCLLVASSPILLLVFILVLAFSYYRCTNNKEEENSRDGHELEELLNNDETGNQRTSQSSDSFPPDKEEENSREGLELSDNEETGDQRASQNAVSYEPVLNQRHDNPLVVELPSNHDKNSDNKSEEREMFKRTLFNAELA